MPRRYITAPVFLSPVLLFYVLMETLMNDAYPPDGDSIAIPLFAYMIIGYPIALYFVWAIGAPVLGRPALRLWNPRKPVLSFFSLVLSVYPLGLFWLTFLQVGFVSRSYGTILISATMVVVTGAVRTYAIQDKEAELPAYADA